MENRTANRESHHGITDNPEGVSAMSVSMTPMTMDEDDMPLEVIFMINDMA